MSVDSLPPFLSRATTAAVLCVPPALRSDRMIVSSASRLWRASESGSAAGPASPASVSTPACASHPAALSIGPAAPEAPAQSGSGCRGATLPRFHHSAVPRCADDDRARVTYLSVFPAARENGAGRHRSRLAAEPHTDTRYADATASQRLDRSTKGGDAR